MHARAVPLTPTLFIGESLEFTHVVADTVDEAVSHILSGLTVLIKDELLGVQIMLKLGISSERAAKYLYMAKLPLPAKH